MLNEEQNAEGRFFLAAPPTGERRLVPVPMTATKGQHSPELGNTRSSGGRGSKHLMERGLIRRHKWICVRHPRKNLKETLSNSARRWQVG